MAHDDRQVRRAFRLRLHRVRSLASLPTGSRRMRTRWLTPLVALVLAIVATGVVSAVSYDGEETCRDVKAWPGGSYLGQMHPHHIAVYTAHARSTNSDRCELWALDLRYSAVRGLRDLGYTVFGPGEFAWPVVPELPPLVEIPPDMLSYRETSGRDAAWATLDLVRGIHAIDYTFDGWMFGPVRIEVVGPDGEVHLRHDNTVPYRGVLKVPAPQAGTYTFLVEAKGQWKLETGERPEVKTRTVVREADLSVEACDAFLAEHFSGG